MIKTVGKYMLIFGLTMALLQVACLLWQPMQWLSFGQSVSGWIMLLATLLLGVLLILFGDELKEQP